MIIIENVVTAKRGEQFIIYYITLLVEIFKY